MKQLSVKQRCNDKLRDLLILKCFYKHFMIIFFDSPFVKAIVLLHHINGFRDAFCLCLVFIFTMFQMKTQGYGTFMLLWALLLCCSHSFCHFVNTLILNPSGNFYLL